MPSLRNTLLATLAATTLTIAGASNSQAFPIAPAGTEGLDVVVGTTGDVTARFEGNSASYTNDLFLFFPGNTLGTIFRNSISTVGSTVNLGTFTAGTVLRFALFVNDTGYTYYTGAASLNPDDVAHARVQANYEPGRTLVSFEDLYGGGDLNYGDLSFSFTNTTNSATPVADVPEPASLALFGAGLLGLFGARRRRNRAA